MLYGEILMPLFQLRRLKEAASRSKMASIQVNNPTGGHPGGLGRSARHPAPGQAACPMGTLSCQHVALGEAAEIQGYGQLSGIVKMGLNLWRMQTMHKESPSEFSPVICVLPAFVGIAK